MNAVRAKAIHLEKLTPNEAHSLSGYRGGSWELNCYSRRDGSVKTMNKGLLDFQLYMNRRNHTSLPG